LLTQGHAMDFRLSRTQPRDRPGEGPLSVDHPQPRVPVRPADEDPRLPRGEAEHAGVTVTQLGVGPGDQPSRLFSQIVRSYADGLVGVAFKNAPQYAPHVVGCQAARQGNLGVMRMLLAADVPCEDTFLPLDGEHHAAVIRGPGDGWTAAQGRVC